MSVPPAEAARLFRESLEPLGEVRSVRLDALDRTGVVTVQANLVLPDEAAPDAYGYGIAEDEALAGALGELCEEAHMHAHCRRAPRVEGSFAGLSRERPACDPRTLMLPAGSDWTPETPMRWMEARRWPSGEPILVPQEWVAAYPHHIPGARTLITPITNGLGAGFDLPHAIAHGLMELTQRDGNVLSFRALDRGVVVDVAEGVEAETSALLARLDGAGLRVKVKCASTSLGLANIYVVGDEDAPRLPIQLTACGEASHPDRHRALRKALLEFCGSRQRKAASHGPIPLLRPILGEEFVTHELEVMRVEDEEPRALSAMTEWVTLPAEALRARLAESVFGERRRIPFTSLPAAAPATIADGPARLALLAERLADEGMEILYVDTSPAGSPVRTAKAIVPGLECETMSYHRIGWRGVKRLRARGDALILDAPREGARRVLLRPEDEARAGGPAWFDAELADRIVGGLYPLYREPSPFAAQVAAERRMAAE
ncbi:MAG: YcaO-like family protein [Acetobacteraceae bacterium]|nr:YcaO-like family protein [Acetobacteraceae bacterium]